MQIIPCKLVCSSLSNHCENLSPHDQDFHSDLMFVLSKNRKFSLDKSIGKTQCDDQVNSPIKRLKNLFVSEYIHLRFICSAQTNHILDQHPGTETFRNHTAVAIPFQLQTSIRVLSFGLWNAFPSPFPFVPAEHAARSLLLHLLKGTLIHPWLSAFCLLHWDLAKPLDLTALLDPLA